MATKNTVNHKKRCWLGFRAVLCFLWLTTLVPNARAHEMNTTYLELREKADHSCGVLLRIPQLGSPLLFQFPEGTIQLSSPVSRTIEGARLSTWSVRLPGPLSDVPIQVDGLAMYDLLVRAELADGMEQTIRLSPGDASFLLEAAPSQVQIGQTYFMLGVEHILGGIDHLLFVLALLILVRGWKKLTGAITTFTVAHSITLALAALGFVHVPGPPVEAIIALSIAFVTMEIIHSQQGRTGISEQHPWVVTLTFGLLHGLGFAGALSEVGLPSTAIPAALLFFNIGVEAGQLLFVAAVLSMLGIFRRFTIPMPEWTHSIPPYIIGSIAMFWVIERAAGF